MKGVEILLYSFRLMLNNLDAALRVSLVPYALIVVLNLYTETLMAPYMQIGVGGSQALPTGGFLLRVFGLALLAAVLSLWIAVAWHRFVLHGEAPAGYFPKWTGDRIAAYFGRGLVLGLLILGVGVALTAVIGPILPPMLAGLVIVFWLLVLFYRLCPVLPAAAIGENLTISQAWNATKGQSGAIIVLSLVGGGVMLLLEVPNMMGGGDSPIGIVYSAVIGWFTMIVGAGILTTFYGHFVEHRPMA